MSISATQVKELRERTGAGIMDCKQALAQTGGDMARAADILRQKGIASAEKRSGRSTSEGRIASYIHGNKVGVLIEVNCETDFVARNEAFGELVNELAMQVAAMNPTYVSQDEIPAEIVQKELEGYKKAALEEGKPEEVAQKIAEGKVRKYFEAMCLLDQPYIRENKKKVSDLITDTIAKTGENIRVRRFTRYALGE